MVDFEYYISATLEFNALDSKNSLRPLKLRNNPVSNSHLRRLIGKLKRVKNKTKKGRSYLSGLFWLERVGAGCNKQNPAV
ncbi:MAG: hypothetical protein ACQEQR_05700 [Pseudomonadota bacterium]